MKVMQSAILALLLGLSIGTASAGPVNINTADASTLAAELSGVGLAKAEAIVAYRADNGFFSAPDELVKVKGIGLATVEKNRDNILTADSE